MAETAFGTLLQIGDGGGTEAFTTIAEVRDITPPQLGLDTTEVTNHSSPGGWEEHIPTILRTGQVSFQANWIPAHATQSYSAGLLKDLVNKTKRNFRIVLPAGATWQFAAYVNAFNGSLPVAGAKGLSVTLRPTGQPTLA